MRKTKDVLGLGRDSDRVYRITEMSALKAEKWALTSFMGHCWRWRRNTGQH